MLMLNLQTTGGGTASVAVKKAPDALDFWLENTGATTRRWGEVSVGIMIRSRMCERLFKLKAIYINRSSNVRSHFHLS